MATAYTTSLKLALPTQGELTGTWGDTLNNQVTSMIEEAVAGLKSINNSSKGWYSKILLKTILHLYRIVEKQSIFLKSQK